MFKSKCIQHRYLMAFFLFLIAFYGYNIQRIYGIYIFPDEFGYWSYAARAAGYDWSDIVSLGSYYSYGYSLILFPILKICSNGVTAYRAAVTVNFALLGVDALILTKLLGKLIQKDSSLSEVIPRESIPLLAGIAVFYPPNLFYAKTSMVETVLMSMFLLISFMIYKYMENNRLAMLIGLLIATVYIHFVHMRAVGVAIAAILTVVFYLLVNSKKRKQLFVVAGICVALTVIGFLLKTWLQGIMYQGASEKLLNVNDYAGQFGKIRYIFTVKGICDFTCSLCGKILYLGIASFGLVYFGTAKCVEEISKYLNTKENRDIHALFYCFLLLSLVGEILINAIYTVHPGRVDSVVYGRYDEFVIPIFMTIGAIEFMECKRKILKIAAIIPLHVIMTYMTIWQVDKYQLTHIHGYFMVGMSYLHNMFPYSTKMFFGTSCIFGLILMLVVTGILWMVKKKRLPYLLAIIILIEFFLFARASMLYQDDSNLGAYRDSILVEKIESLLQRDEDRRLVYLKEKDTDAIQSIQFLLPDKKINMRPLIELQNGNISEEVDSKDIILLDYDSNYWEKLNAAYYHNMIVGRFQIFYN